MNSIQIHKILSNHVNYFEVVYLLDLLPSTLIKPAIIVINLDKHYMHGSHWVAVCLFGFRYAEYFDSYALTPFKLKSWHTCSATQFLPYLTATDYRV